MTPTELESHLMPIALAVAEPMTLSPQCEQDLRRLIRKSAAHVTPQSLGHAVQNVKRLILEMRRRAENQTLQERTLSEALGLLCPLFPFC